MPSPRPPEAPVTRATSPILLAATAGDRRRLGKAGETIEYTKITHQFKTTKRFMLEK